MLWKCFNRCGNYTQMMGTLCAVCFKVKQAEQAKRQAESFSGGASCDDSDADTWSPTGVKRARRTLSAGGGRRVIREGKTH